MKKTTNFICFLTLFAFLFLYFINQHPHIDAIKNPEKYWSSQQMSHHALMIYQGSEEVPDDMKIAEDPKFPVGSKAISIANHMGGMMKNVQVTIVGAYETTAYGTNYQSTIDGRLIKNHKWIVQEELLDVGQNLLKPGAKALTTAQHMKGMKGAVHQIEFAETTTVYMVNFIAKNGEKVSNHKWVIEDELTPVS